MLRYTINDMRQVHIHYGRMRQLQGQQSEWCGSISDSAHKPWSWRGENNSAALNELKTDVRLCDVNEYMKTSVHVWDSFESKYECDYRSKCQPQSVCRYFESWFLFNFCVRLSLFLVDVFGWCNRPSSSCKTTSLRKNAVSVKQSVFTGIYEVFCWRTKKETRLSPELPHLPLISIVCYKKWRTVAHHYLWTTAPIKDSPFIPNHDAITCFQLTCTNLKHVARI